MSGKIKRKYSEEELSELEKTLKEKAKKQIQESKAKKEQEKK